MGISNQIPNSRIAQAGVVPDTANRPASPYEGQMLYQKDTNQVLVYDGSAWVAPNSGTANPPGLELVTGCTVTSSGGTAATVSNGVVTTGNGNTSVTISNAFSSSYKNYRIVFGYGTTSAGGRMNVQLSGTTGSNYYTVGYYLAFGVATVNPLATSGNGETTWYGVETNTGGFSAVMDIFNPQQATKTFMTVAWMTNGLGATVHGVENTTNVSTGFTLTLASGNINSNMDIRVYGYRN